MGGSHDLTRLAAGWFRPLPQGHRQAGLQVKIDRKGGQCAFHAEAVAAFLADITADEGDDFKRRFVEMLAELEPEDWKLLERMAEKLQKKEGNP